MKLSALPNSTPLHPVKSRNLRPHHPFQNTFIKKKIQTREKKKATTKPAFLLNSAAWSSLVSVLLHVVRPGHESGGCWDWGIAKEMGFSQGGEEDASPAQPTFGEMERQDLVSVTVGSHHWASLTGPAVSSLRAPVVTRGERTRGQGRRTVKWEVKIPRIVSLRHLEEIN